MWSALLTEAKGLVDKKFMLNGFFPCLVFLLSAGLLAAAANGGVDQWLGQWENLSGVLQAISLIGVVSVVFVLAAFVLSGELLLIRLFEGYIGPGFLRRAMAKRQEAQRTETAADRELLFPQRDLRPTTLGNVLAAAEEYPKRAYGLDSLVVWPRLFVILPDSELNASTAARNSMHFLLLISFLSWAMALLGGVYAAAESLGAAIYLVTVVGGGVLGSLAYKAAVQAAIDYGLYVRTAFDLHRNDLLAKLRRPLPTTGDEEHRTWEASRSSSGRARR